MRKKIRLKIKVYDVMSESIYNSIKAGYRKALKHTETPPPEFPDEETIAEHIHNYIMNDLCDLVNWDKSSG